MAFSACPQDIVKIQGQGDNTPKPVEIVVLDAFQSELPGTRAWVPEG